MRAGPLGDPFKAMRKAASEGAAGFRFSPGLLTEEKEALVFGRTAGRVLFPFLVRREEAASQWPTVLGSGRLCDVGVYLTRRGEAKFGPHDLCQWLRWDVMDRASAELTGDQPLRSHDPGEPFSGAFPTRLLAFTCCRADQRFTISDASLVLFARDQALRQFVPPEGYYPVFPSEEAAREFLQEHLGGAFHIIKLVTHSPSNIILHTGLMAQDLGKGGALIARPERIDSARHLERVRERFPPPRMRPLF